MYSEGRLTRSRARTLAAENGQTPLFLAPTDGKTPGTRSRTTRKAAGAEAATPRAALFDVTNAAEEEVQAAPVVAVPELPPLDETKPMEFGAYMAQPAAPAIAEEPEPAAEVEAPAPPTAEVPVPQQLEVEGGENVEATEEQQALPELSVEESVERVLAAAPEEAPATPPPAALPASPAHLAPAPTPTGLGLSTLAPMSPLGPTALLSASTPAVTPLHGVPAGSPQASKVYDTLAAAAQAFAGQQQPQEAEEQEAAPVAGFGSPVKVSESPTMSLTFGGYVAREEKPAAGEAEEEVCSGSPPGASIGMASPGMDLASPAEEAPEALAAPSPAPKSPTPVLMEEPVEQAIMEEAPAEAAPKPTVRSKVVVASPYDPRSLRQLKKEIKQKLEEREAASAPNSEGEEEEEEGDEYCADEEAAGELLEAMGALDINSPALGPYGLRGMPKPAGQHIRFDEDGQEYVSPRLKTLLRGMPTPHGKHMFFEDDE